MEDFEPKKNKSPDVSIDEALEMFLTLTYPGGVPEEVDKEQLLNMLRDKIAEDRPDWAEKSEASKPAQKPVMDGENYSKIKQAIIEQSNRPEIPEDPEERYLYERKQEALANLNKKLIQEREEAKRQELLRRLNEQNRERNLESREKDSLGNIPQFGFEPKEGSLLPRQFTVPQFSGEDQSSGLKLEENENLKIGFDDQEAGLSGDEADRQVEMFKAIEKLDRQDRINAMRAFNDSRRKMIGTKKSVLKPRDSFTDKGDDRFSMDTDNTPTEKDDNERRFLNYLHERRAKGRGGLSFPERNPNTKETVRNNLSNHIETGNSYFANLNAEKTNNPFLKNKIDLMDGEKLPVTIDFIGDSDRNNNTHHNLSFDMDAHNEKMKRLREADSSKRDKIMQASFESFKSKKSMGLSLED